PARRSDVGADREGNRGGGGAGYNRGAGGRGRRGGRECHGRVARGDAAPVGAAGADHREPAGAARCKHRAELGRAAGDGIATGRPRLLAADGRCRERDVGNAARRGAEAGLNIESAPEETILDRTAELEAATSSDAAGATDDLAGGAEVGRALADLAVVEPAVAARECGGHAERAAIDDRFELVRAAATGTERIGARHPPHEPGLD